MDKVAKFYLDLPGTKEVILNGNGVKKFEKEYMKKRLSEIEAAFMQKFGFNGTFELQFMPTRFRSAWRIRAADRRTGAALKREPGWLAQFSRVKI